MVSLAVCQRMTSSTQAPQVEDKLRNLAMWYPDIPGSTLCLNDNSFLPRDHYVDGYKPLVWVSFGGPRGIYLQHLTRVSAMCWGVIHRIDFSYNKESPVEHQTFGRHKPRYFENVIDFSIDGPGGEVINAIEVYQHYDISTSRDTWGAKEGALVSCKVSKFRPQMYHSSHFLIYRNQFRLFLHIDVHEPRKILSFLPISNFAERSRSEVAYHSPWDYYHRILWNSGTKALDESIVATRPR